MPCSHLYIFSAPRMILCQKEDLLADTNCAEPTYEWTPGGATTEEIPLVPETTQDVEVTCPGCGGPATDEICIPVIMPGCGYSTPSVPSAGIAFECLVGTSFSADEEIMAEKYECAGDAIDWTTVEFDYTHVPTGITCAYGGADKRIEATVDFDLVRSGVYYVPTRVYSTSGIASNWALTRILVGIQLDVAGFPSPLGDCCEP